jgi:hypothetical protein
MSDNHIINIKMRGLIFIFMFHKYGDIVHLCTLPSYYYTYNPFIILTCPKLSKPVQTCPEIKNYGIPQS